MLFLILTLFFGVQLCQGQNCSSYETEKINEGYKKLCYKDSAGLPTIGVGCQMEANKDLINKVTNGSYDLLINSGDPNYFPCGSGTTSLTDDQIQTLFNVNIQTASQCASTFVPNMPLGPQSGITDMAFNMGCSKLTSDWPSLKSALTNKDYVEAGYQITHSSTGGPSAFCTQRQDRCMRDKGCVCLSAPNPTYCNGCDQKCSNFPGICCGGTHPNCCSFGCCQNNYTSCCPSNLCCSTEYPVCCSIGCCPSDNPICCSNGCCPSGTTCCSTGCCRLEDNLFLQEPIQKQNAMPMRKKE